MNWYKGKSIKLTGASGYIGGQLKLSIEAQGGLGGNAQPTDVFFHLAAQTSAKTSNSHPTFDVLSNLI